MDEENDWSEGAFDLEIEKMTKDADAILESIREVAGVSVTSEESLSGTAPLPLASLHVSKETITSHAASLPHKNTLQDYDTDDDMSDTVTVDSLIKRELGTALQEAEFEFRVESTKEVNDQRTSSHPTPPVHKEVDPIQVTLMGAVWTMVLISICLLSWGRAFRLDDDGRIGLLVFANE